MAERTGLQSQMERQCRCHLRAAWPYLDQDIELMAKHQDLCFQRGSRSEKSDQPAPDQPAELVHRAEDSADSLPRANRIKFATGTPVAVSLMPRIYFRFRWHSGHGRTCCWLEPVANEPKPTSVLQIC